MAAIGTIIEGKSAVRWQNVNVQRLPQRQRRFSEDVAKLLIREDSAKLLLYHHYLYYNLVTSFKPTKTFCRASIRIAHCNYSLSWYKDFYRPR